LRNYDWPGNVRELMNLIQRLLIVGSDSEVSIEEVEVALGTSMPGVASSHGVTINYEIILNINYGLLMVVWARSPKQPAWSGRICTANFAAWVLIPKT